MESLDSVPLAEKRKFRLYEHPWLAMLVVMVMSVVSMVLASIIVFGLLGWPDDTPRAQFAHDMTMHILMGFIFAPFILHLPKGKRSYRQYLDDIGLTRVQPFFWLIVLALSCYVILALSQAGSSIIYRLFEGQVVDGAFIRQVFDLSPDLPPLSAGLLTTIPSAFEEVGFRGIVLVVFLRKYPERKAIVFSSIGFALMHLLNLTNGREPVWVMGQLVWAFSIGLFYGYIFVKTRSLLPSMIIHYLSNAFIWSLTGYMQMQAPAAIEALYGVIFTLGIVPTVLMIGWTRFFTSRWPVQPERQEPVAA